MSKSQVSKGLAGSLIIAFGLLLTPMSASPAAAASRSAQSFYVDAASGNNSNPGTSAQPWKDLTKVNGTGLVPGDQILLKRGSVFRNAGLALGASGASGSPIRIASYGNSSDPMPQVDLSSVNATHWPNQNWGGQCVWLGGSFVTIEGVSFRSCQAVGVQVTGDNVVLRNNEITDNSMGIFIESGADNATIESNNIHDNTRMMVTTPCSSNCSDDYGANGILLAGDDAVIRDNTINGSVGPSPDFGTDGAAIEIFGSNRASITNNRADNNVMFVELGGSSASDVAADNTISNNTVNSSLTDSAFILVNGPINNSAGFVTGTNVTSNKALLTGPRARGVWCSNGCRRSGDPVRLTLSNNTIWTVTGLTADCSGPEHGTCTSNNNVYPPSTGNPSAGCWGNNDGMVRSGDTCQKSSAALTAFLTDMGLGVAQAAQVLATLGSLVTAGTSNPSPSPSPSPSPTTDPTSPVEQPSAVNQAASVPMCQGRPATIVGTDGNDVIRGTSGDDVIVALGGDDLIIASDGNDVVCGGEGRDSLKGGRGNDVLFGEGGKDWISGGKGRNKVRQ